VVSYTSTTPVPIQDFVTNTGTQNLSDTGPILDVNVQINIVHTWDGDVSVGLAHNAVTIDLTSNNGGSADNYLNTIFDDEAALSIVGQAAPFAGTFKPEQALSAYDGMDKTGTWTIITNDNAGGDVGTLTYWTLLITGSDDGNGNGIPDECEAACECPGDTNDDGLIDGDDIQGFVDCLISGTSCECTDMDGDGDTADVDADDLPLFIAALLSGATCP